VTNYVVVNEIMCALTAWSRSFYSLGVQTFSAFYKTRRFIIVFRRTPHTVPILSQINPVRIIKPHSFNFCCIFDPKQCIALLLVPGCSFRFIKPEVVPIARAVCCRYPTAAVRVRSQVIYMEFMVGKMTLWHVFSEYFGVPCQFSFYRLHRVHYSSNHQRNIHSIRTASLNNQLKKC
jgi:hypothetical protein